MSMPKPMRKVKRSRSVIARFAGSVSSSGPSSRFNTWRSASSGNSPSTGSSSRSLHSSTRIIAAAAVTGFVIEATYFPWTPVEFDPFSTSPGPGPGLGSGSR